MEKEPELLGVYQAAEQVQWALRELVNTLRGPLGEFEGSAYQAAMSGGPCDSVQFFVEKHLPAIRCSALQLDAVFRTTSTLELLCSYDDILKTPDNVSFDLVGALVSVLCRLRHFIVALTRDTMETEFCQTWHSSFQDAETSLSREIRRLEALDWDIKAWVFQRAKAAILAHADGTRTDQRQTAEVGSSNPSRQVGTWDSKTDNETGALPKLSELFDNAQSLVSGIIAVARKVSYVSDSDGSGYGLAHSADVARDGLLNLARQVQQTIADARAYRGSLAKADSPVPETLVRCLEDYEQRLCELEDAAKGLLLRFRLSTLPPLGTKAWAREAKSIGQFSDRIAEAVHALADEPLLHDECLSELLPDADATREPTSRQEVLPTACQPPPTSLETAAQAASIADTAMASKAEPPRQEESVGDKAMGSHSTTTVAKIPANERTKPLTFRQAAKLMGKAQGKGLKDAAEWLSAAVKDGSIRCEHITRQAHVFSKRDFPENVWSRILPAVSPTDPE